MNRRRSLLLSWTFLAVCLMAGCDDDEDVLAPVGCGGSPGPIVTPAVVQVVPGAPSYRVGDTVEVVVAISNASDVGSITYRLLYSPSVLEFESPAEEGSFMDCDGAGTAFLAGDAPPPDEIAVAQGRFGGGDGVSGEGVLATFRFTALAAGRSVFAFTGAVVKDPQANTLPASFVGASIDVEP